MTDVYIGIGSNVSPQENMQTCMSLLKARWPDIRFSHLSERKAMEVEKQSDFLDAVGCIATSLPAEAVQVVLQEVEQKLGKAPPYRFGPRTIDLDILLYGSDVITLPHLTVPHPRMHERKFVLAPLCELIDTKKKHPLVQLSWKELLEEVEGQMCERL